MQFAAQVAGPVDQGLLDVHMDVFQLLAKLKVPAPNLVISRLRNCRFRTHRSSVQGGPGSNDRFGHAKCFNIAKRVTGGLEGIASADDVSER